MFKNPFSFEGRIRRKEFGLSFIIFIVITALLSVIADNLGEASNILDLAFIPLLWFFVAQATKRCHDRGNSGWYQIFTFYFFWLLFADSQYGHNEYGPNPKGVGNFAETDLIGEHLTQ